MDVFEKADREIGNFVSKYFTCIMLFVLLVGVIITILTICGLVGGSAIFAFLLTK